MATENTPRRTHKYFREAIWGICFALLFYGFRSIKSENEHVFAEAALIALAAGFIARFLYTIEGLHHAVEAFDGRVSGLADRISSLEKRLVDLWDQIVSDQRIIYARDESQRQNKIDVVGVEEFQLDLARDRPLPQCGAQRWENSISILRFDRIQDLLFSQRYLEHFFSLRQKSAEQKRILVINDIPRSSAAVQAFLAISRGLDVTTYIYKKSEFYEMIEHLFLLIQDSADLKCMQSILKGNPELNLMVKEPQQFQEWNVHRTVKPNEDYALRYQIEGGTEVAVRKPGDQFGKKIESKHIARLFRLMHAALQPSRQGPGVVDAILRKRDIPENYWSPAHLEMLKSSWR